MLPLTAPRTVKATHTNMSNQPGKPSEFPWNDFHLKEFPPQMTLRDWFAGQIFAAALASAQGLGGAPKEERMELLRQGADISYEAADAMLAARNNPPAP